MNYHKLELHIAQVERAINQFRCKFHDSRKQAAYNNLIELFFKIKNGKNSYKTFDDNSLITAKQALDEVFYGIEHLHYDSNHELPEEMILCLEMSISDWINNSENFLIVTSLNNNLEEFYFRPYMQSLTLNIKTLFDHEHKQTLIKIGKPRILLTDFLSAVPMYHELGHFIDRYYQISQTIINYEPKLAYLKKLTKEEQYKTLNHYSEYFADLFAAQYIGKSCSEYLNYVSFKNGNSFTHPSTSNRTDMVEAFLSGVIVPEIEYIKYWTKIRTKGKLLEIRNAPLSFDPFTNESPKAIENLSEIHSLFPAAWEHWLNDNSPIRVKYPDSTKACNQLNKIIRKSIRTNMKINKAEKARAMWYNFLNSYSTIKRNFFQY